MVTEIEKKALALWNDERAWEGLPPWFLGDVEADAGFRAICRAVEELEAEKAARAADREQHEAFRQDINDELLAWFGSCLPEDFTPFIIPKTDPLVEVLDECGFGVSSNAADNIREAIEKRGGKIVWGEG